MIIVQAQNEREQITQAASDLNHTHSVEFPIEIDTCFDFGTLFCRVFYGMKLLGNFWRRDNYWLSEPFYQNPQREHLVHTDSSEAITFIFDCYLGKRSCHPVALPKKEYAVILETIETDEYGAPFESQVIVEWDADVPIDWNSWLAWYEYEHCAEFRLVSIQLLLEPEEF